MFDLSSMIEWYLLRLRAFADFTAQKVDINTDSIDDKVGAFCEEYFTYRKDLGGSAVRYWPGEIIGEV